MNVQIKAEAAEAFAVILEVTAKAELVMSIVSKAIPFAVASPWSVLSIGGTSLNAIPEPMFDLTNLSIGREALAPTLVGC